MTKFNPNVTPEEIENAKTAISDCITNITSAKARMAKNPYNGKYAGMFAKCYTDVYSAVFAVRKEFEDGFQVSDLDDIIIVAAPAVVALYRNVSAQGLVDAELEDFMTDLVLFGYYEVSDLIKWGILKIFLKAAFKLYVARKIGKVLANLVRYADGKLDATDVDEKVLAIYQGVKSWLNGAEI